MMPIRWIFRSRWAALFWAGGICWTAVQIAGPGASDGNKATDADGATINAQDMKQAEELLRKLGG